MRYKESVRIDADPETVWSVLVDLERWPEWTTSMARVEVLGDGPVGLGTRVRVKQPRLPTVVWRVTDWQPGRSFTWQAERTPVPSVGEHRIELDDDGSSRVELVFEQRGPLAPVLALVSGRMTRRYVALEATGLRTRSESARRG